MSMFLANLEFLQYFVVVVIALAHLQCQFSFKSAQPQKKIQHHSPSISIQSPLHTQRGKKINTTKKISSSSESPI